MPTALVIGASRGIGKEFVNLLVQGNWNVYASARSVKESEQLGSNGAKGIVLDVTDPESLASVGLHLKQVSLDLVLYVAGIYGPEQGAMQAPGAAEFDLVMHTNVLGAMHSVQLFAPNLSLSKGKFIFISSLMGSVSATQSSFGLVYRCSKAALNMCVKAASFDYPDVIFTLLNPGWVRTDMGGSNATISVNQSVSGMLEVIKGLSIKDSGSFLSYQGKAMQW